MVRFTDNSIIIEISTGIHPIEHLAKYQNALLEALMNLKTENLNSDALEKINLYLGDLLQNLLMSKEQLTNLSLHIQEDNTDTTYNELVKSLTPSKQVA